MITPENPKRILPEDQQFLHMLLAQSCTAEGEDTIIAYLKFLRKFMGIFSDDGKIILKKKFGKNYDHKIKQLRALHILVQQIRSYQSGLDKGTIEKQDITNARFRYYSRALSLLPQFEPVAHEIGTILIEHSSIKDLRIKNLYFQLVLPKEKKLEVEKREKMSKAPDAHQDM